MNNMVEETINAKKNSILDNFQIDDINTRNKVEELFSRIQELGKNCNDVGEFETKFFQSELSKEYTDLFGYIASNYKLIGVTEAVDQTLDDTKQALKNTVDDEIKRGIKDSTLPLRRKLREEIEKDARGIPIIGDLMQAKNSFDLFKKFKKK